ncbi:MAG: hypothetical protein ACOC4G_02440 [Bacillota bacterium]
MLNKKSTLIITVVCLILIFVFYQAFTKKIAKKEEDLNYKMNLMTKYKQEYEKISINEQEYNNTQLTEHDIMENINSIINKNGIKLISLAPVYQTESLEFCISLEGDFYSISNTIRQVSRMKAQPELVEMEIKADKITGEKIFLFIKLSFRMRRG